MNCQSCNTRIDYRFVTNCPQCGSAIEHEGEAEFQPVSNSQPAERVKKRVSLGRILVNSVYVVFISGTGLVLGAVGVLTGAKLFFEVFDALFPNALQIGCGTGSLIGFLCFCGGAFLGTIGGAAFAIRRPIFKTRSN
jgi:hypothetical protein